MKVLRPDNPIDVGAPKPWGPLRALGEKAKPAVFIAKTAFVRKLQLPSSPVATQSPLAHFPDQGIREAFFATSQSLPAEHAPALVKVGLALIELGTLLQLSTIDAALLKAPTARATMALFGLEDSLINSARTSSLTPADRARFVHSADRITDLHDHLMIATDTTLPPGGLAGQRLRALTEGPAEVMAKQMRLMENARTFFDEVSSDLWPSLSKKVNSAVKTFARQVPAVGLPEFKKTLLHVEDELLAKLKGSQPDEAMRFQLVIAANGLNDMYDAAAVMAGTSQPSATAPSGRLFKELQRLARVTKPADEQ